MKFSNLRRQDKSKLYGIRADYAIRASNEDYFDGTSFNDNIIYQPHVYELAGYLAKRSKAEYIIDIGAGNGEKIKQYLGSHKVIAVDCDVNLKELKSNLPGQQIIEFDLEKGLPDIPIDILSKSIVISADVIEHIVNLEGYLTGLARFSKYAPFMLISTPDRDKARGVGDTGPPANQAHVREWTATELDYLLRLFGIDNLRTGYTINTNVHKEKSTILCMGGTHNISKRTAAKAQLKKVLAIITLFNEADIIEHSITNLLRQGVDVHVIDNWSTDNSAKVVKGLAKKNRNRITYEKFPKTPPNEYMWTELLDRVDEIAAASSYDWIMHHDADEIRKSPHQEVTIQQAISLVDELGYNLIDHTILDFRPVSDSVFYDGSRSPEHFFNYYEYGRRPGHFQQVKGWKNENETVNLSKGGGHLAKKQNPKIYPLKFVLKHYPLRSPDQGRKKVFTERKPRISGTERRKGWHHQYTSFDQDFAFKWDHKLLCKFHQVRYWQENLVEQISGIGVVDENVNNLT